MITETARLLEELYAVPPSTFTRERNARAAVLAKAGHADEARTVKQLRRPSPSLWATNQLARKEAKRLAAFIDAVGRIRAALLRDPRAAAEALRQQRVELEALVQRAGEELSSQGYRLTPDMARRISDTLLGAAVDRRLAEDLRHGRLTAELAPPGFEVLGGASGAGPLRLLPGGAAPQEKETREKAESARRAKAREAEEARQRERREAEEERQRRRHDAEEERQRRRHEAEEERQRQRHEAAEAEHQRRRHEAEEERQRQQREAEVLDREAAARQAAAKQLEREAADAAATLAQARRRLRDAIREAKAAAAAARKARRARR